MVREGYKQTEVGVIPEDWESRRIGDSIDFKNGLNKAKEFFGFGTPIVNYMDVFNNEGIRSNDINGRVSVTSEEKAAYSARVGDLFFTRTSETVDEIGVSAVLVEEIKDAVFSGFVLRGREKPNTSVFELGFKKYCFQSEVVRRQICSSASYTTRALTNGKLLSKVLVPTPTNPNEQKAIAQTLSDVDGLIASLEALIAKKRALKTATMQQLLTGKTRLDGFGAGKGMKQTELGEIPKDWDVVPLGEIGKPVIGLTYKPSDVSDEGTLVLRSSNIQDGTLAYENNVFVKHDVPQRVITCEGDLLICVRNGSRSLIGKCALIDNKAAGSAFGAFMSLFKSDESKFVYFQFQSRVIKKQIEDTMGATINQITNKDLNRFCIPFPKSKQERAKITEILSDLELEAQSLVSRLTKIKCLKQGMMQELLTGRTRLV